MSQPNDYDRNERRAHAIMATMGQQRPTLDERREHVRRRLLTRATVRRAGERDVLLYTRDATDRGVGFLSADLGADLLPNVRTTIEIPGPDGQPVQVVGEVVRTRTVASGWHEGYVRFDTPVKLFCETPIRAA